MRWICWLIGVLATTGLALAQEMTLPDPGRTAEKSTAMQWLITGVFLVAALVVAFKPAKRSKLE